jgi:hypothetical protein
LIISLCTLQGDEQWYKAPNPPESPKPISEADHQAALKDVVVKSGGGGEKLPSIRKLAGGEIIHTEAMKDYHDLFDYWVNSASMSSCDSAAKV